MYKGLLTCLTAVAIASPTGAQPVSDNLAEEQGLYTPIADIQLRTTSAEFRLSELYARQPVLVALIFTRCTGICNPFLLELSEHMRALDPKEKFEVLVVSFDSRDSNADMERYARLFNLERAERWVFATTDQIDELNRSVGFLPTWDSTRQQYDHNALLVGVNGNGYITRKMEGIRDRKDVESMIKTIDGEFIPSYPLPREGVLFSCFTYDPVTGVRKPSFGLLILLVPAMLTLMLLLWLGMKSRKWRSDVERIAKPSAGCP